MIQERIKDGLIHSKVEETLKRMDRELMEVIEDFMHVVDVKTLCITRKLVSTPCLNLRMVHPQWLHVEQELLHGQLTCVKAGYDLKHHCMEGTHRSILNQTMNWVKSPQGRNDRLWRNTYWFYSSPSVRFWLFQ
jgi:hypothetical protein